MYRHKDASDGDFEKIDSFFKRVLAEDKYLCEEVQKNLNAGVYTNGELHPDLESAPIYFQKIVRGLLTEHRNNEDALGKEVWPASRRPLYSEATDQDDAFCEGLVCKAEQNGHTDW